MIFEDAIRTSIWGHCSDSYGGAVLEAQGYKDKTSSENALKL
jgi:hypothetical protein